MTAKYALHPGPVTSKSEQRTEARQAALERDAARYRWLREQHTYDGEGDSDIKRWYVQAGREPVPCDPGALDAEIDAAMAAR